MVLVRYCMSVPSDYLVPLTKFVWYTIGTRGLKKLKTGIFFSSLDAL